MFNGDNKQIDVKDSQNNSIGQYFYDGEGKRIKKITNTEITVFVYNGAGQLIAEYSTQTNSSPTTSYLTNDNLGSPRVITDALGNVISRRDFMPFGEEIYSGIGGRTENQKYTQNGVDNIRKRFTGYEKDTETGLDFAEARYYHNAHGRFTAVDPLLASGKSANPQTFNRYAYTMNNPVNLIDPSGMISESTGACGERCPNSGPMVDGSAFQGQDSSFDWNKQQAKQPSVPLSISDYSKILENLPDFSFTRKSLVISGEKGGNSIEHPKKRLIIIEEATLEIEAKRLPEIKTKQVEDENGNTKTTNIYTYQITDRLVDLFGNEIIDYSSQTFYYNDNGIATIKEPWADPLVTFTVEDDNTEIYDDRLNITIKSGEEETSVDYTVQTVSNTVTVPLDYNNKVKIRPRIVFVAIPEN